MWLQTSPSSPSWIERLASRGHPYTVELVLSGRAPARKARSDHEPPAVAGRGGQGRQPRHHATLYLTPLHGRADVLKRLIANIGEAFQHVKAAAEQYKDPYRWRCLLRCVGSRIAPVIGPPKPPPGALASG